MTEDYGVIQHLADNDVEVLKEKGRTYGDSWRKRGGQGAYMMLARKWDRIEEYCSQHGYNIFAAITNDTRNAGDDLFDDIRDLRRYLLLVDGYMQDTRPILEPAVMSSVQTKGVMSARPTITRHGRERQGGDDWEYNRAHGAWVCPKCGEVYSLEEYPTPREAFKAHGECAGTDYVDQ